MFEILESLELSSFLFSTIIILLVMVFAFIIIFFITYNRNLSIQKAMKNMEQKHQEHNLATLENERQRFARDLHDEIGASLSAIRLYVSDIHSRQEDEEVKVKLKQVKQTIDQSMASTRRISHNILPPGLEHMGLSHVVNDLVNTFNVSEHINVSVHAAAQMPKLDYDRELILYRVLQELLNNTIKHANASFIDIRFDYNADYYLIQYTDNGIGFDMDEMGNDGIGMKNVKSRVAMAKGEFILTTAIGKGFSIELKIPLKPE
jgi:two-component system NarL family sensor kinase